MMMTPVGHYHDSMATQEDAPPAASCCADDFEAYLVANWDALHRFSYLTIGNKQDAEDALQEAAANLWRHWARVRAAGDPTAYMRRAIVNARISAWRKSRRMVAYADMEAYLPHANDAQSRLDSIVAADLLRTMPRKQRAIVVMRFLEDMTFRDIAEICGITEAAARSSAHRSLLAMRAAITGEE